MSVINLDSENLQLDWISFNLEGLMDPKIIAGRLLKYFTPHVLIDDVPSIGFHGFKKKYKVSIHQYHRIKGLLDWNSKLFSLVKMLVIFINFSKLENLIGIFSSSRSIL
jgi:hypothetical protein